MAALPGKSLSADRLTTCCVCCSVVDRRWREPAGREDHSTAVAGGNDLYLWGGGQKGNLQVHDSAEKRAFLSNVEVFSVSTGCWEQHITSGTPPLGVQGYSCVAVGSELLYFGGWCGHNNCYHNSVHSLSTSTLQWRMLAPTTSEGKGPMRKWCCGMVHFTDGEEDLLYVMGGYGHTAPSSPQHGAQYIKYYPVLPWCQYQMNSTFSLCPQVSDMLLLFHY